MPKGRKPRRNEKFVPSADHRAAVEVMAGFSISHDEIRRAIINPATGKPITKKTLERCFVEELRNGRSKVKLHVATTLLSRAKSDKSGACAIFMGKVVLGMRTVDQHEFGGIANGAPINIQELTNAQLDQLIAILEKRIASSGGPEGGAQST
jgi:hypothetical protein